MKNVLFLLLAGVSVFAHAQQYTWTELPNHTWADTVHHPFVLGVASSEPGTDHVYLWTYCEPDFFTQPSKSVNWELSTDSSFSTILQSGTTTADSSRSWTLDVQATGLIPNTYYWYRFDDGAGNTSVTGRTRTLPTDNDDITLAITSCSNFIAYYNTYARLAERDDLNAIVHLGDWGYDNLNEDRSVRIPDPNVTIRCGLEERRKRDYLHLLDPDLRAVRAKHPFFLIWDNHDVQRGDPEPVKDGCRKVFREFQGMPVVDPLDISRQYRKVSMGPLVDLFLVDIQWTQDRRDSINGYESYLGAAQHTWLLDELAASTAKWKLIGQQKLMGQFSIATLASLIPGGIDADEKSWEGYEEEREDILEFIRDNEIDNVMVLSGDAHFVIIEDLAIDPFNILEYNGSTGEGSVAVEFLPSAISSPNIDERGVPYTLNSILQSLSIAANPHQMYAEFMDNGYGILTINSDSIQADLWLLDCQSINDDQYLADEQTLLDKANHWKRPGDVFIGVEEDMPGMGVISLAPNPSDNEMTLDFLSVYTSDAQMQIIDMQGKIISDEQVKIGTGRNQIDIQVRKLPSGTYLLKLITAEDILTERFVKQ